MPTVAAPRRIQRSRRGTHAARRRDALDARRAVDVDPLGEDVVDRVVAEQFVDRALAVAPPLALRPCRLTLRLGRCRLAPISWQPRSRASPAGSPPLATCRSRRHRSNAKRPLPPSPRSTRPCRSAPGRMAGSSPVSCPIAISSAMFLPAAGPALKPYVPQPTSRMNPSMSWHGAHDRAVVRRHVADAGPLPQHLDAARATAAAPARAPPTFSRNGSVERFEYDEYGSISDPMTSSPRSVWLTYTCSVAETSTGSRNGFSGSVTSACSGWVTIGRCAGRPSA